MKTTIRNTMAVVTVIFSILAIIGLEYSAEVSGTSMLAVAVGAVQLAACFIACYAVFGVTK